MKKIVRLTESDLIRLVKRVISEQTEPNIMDLMNKIEQIGYDNKRGGLNCGSGNMETITFGAGIYMVGIGQESIKPKDIITPYTLTINGPCGKFKFGITIEKSAWIDSTDEYIQKLNNFWISKGYNLKDLSSVLSSSGTINKFLTDLKSFLTSNPPTMKGTQINKPKTKISYKP